MKDIILWGLFVGVPVSFNAVNEGEEEHIKAGKLFDWILAIIGGHFIFHNESCLWFISRDKCY